MERTFVAIKPDGVQRGLIGEIVKRFENRGYILCGAKLIQVTPEMTAAHYAEHVGKPFYNGLVNYITSGPVFAMVWEGENVIAGVRQTVGATNPVNAAPGTIRHDFAAKMDRNLIHASDSPESAAREISIWFKDEEVLTWEKIGFNWVFGRNS